MTDKSAIIVKPPTAQAFETLWKRGRVLFFSAPCGFGKTVLADTLLDGRPVLRLNAADTGFALPSLEDAWDILLIDNIQDMQEERDWQAAIYPRFLQPRLSMSEALTAAEMQVLRLICADKSNAEIAQIMDVKLPTVKTHVSHILDKLDVKRRAEAKTAAKKLHLVQDDL